MPAPRIARSVPTSVRQPDPKRNASHLAFLRKLPCLCCGASGPCVAAHIRIGTDGGMATKPSDRYAVPLLDEHHRRQHSVGEVTFWSEAGIDATAVAERLYRISGDIAQGERTIARALLSRRSAA